MPDLLKLALREYDDDPREFTQRFLCFGLFYPGGALGMKGLLADSLEGVDRKLLFEVVKKLLKNDDGRARSCIASLYKQLSFEELKPIWPDIFEAARNQAPSGVMFASAIRLSSMKLFADNKVKEGLPLFFDVMDIDKWGKNRRVMNLLTSLEAYGPEATKLVLPQMKTLAEGLAAHREPRMFPGHLKILNRMIEEAEAAQGTANLLSIEQALDVD